MKKYLIRINSSIGRYSSGGAWYADMAGQLVHAERYDKERHCWVVLFNNEEHFVSHRHASFVCTIKKHTIPFKIEPVTREQEIAALKKRYTEFMTELGYKNVNVTVEPSEEEPNNWAVDVKFYAKIIPGENPGEFRYIP